MNHDSVVFVGDDAVFFVSGLRVYLCNAITWA